jgi:hypothetical protein
MIDAMASKLRSFRVDDELWAAATAIARDRDESLSSDVLRPALSRYVERHGGATPPKIWIVAFEWEGMPRVGSGPVAMVTEDENGDVPQTLMDPVAQSGEVLPGLWLYDGRDEKARVVIYRRPDQ